ncbi:MAG: glycoside hydrolase family 97 protein [Tannerella sp.]|jgi:alpha-glucosidase|nr:glycoside hydrolase family 97 protein [Tannerella sp.]
MNKLFCVLVFFAYGMTVYTNEATVGSPDGKYRMKVYDRDGKAWFTVDYEGRPVILESQLGINGNGEWNDNVRVDGCIATSTDTLWKPVYGEREIVRDRYNQYEITLTNPDNPRRHLYLIVRAYNEGIAFRYFFPGNEYLHITREYTQYTLPEGTKAYHTKRAQSVCELLPLRDWPGESERPLLLKAPQGPYVLLTEAGVVDYVRTKFVLDAGKPNTITGAMYGDVDHIAPYRTPWRVIMAAGKAGRLIENNDLLLNLNPPCEIENTWWIRPGKVMREVTLTTEGGKALVDFAVKRNLQYIHFDAGWYGPEGSKDSDASTVSIDPARSKDPDALNLKEVIEYARKRNVGVILYVNQRALYRQLDEILPLYASWGVAGVKFGFVMVGSQFWTTWMHEAVKKCAEYGLMADIHDEYRPTGFSRTYPNLMTQEGVYGNEEFPDATHNVTLPFTRFTQGAADYTICYYRRKWDEDTRPDTAHGLVNARLLKTTAAHQLAMAAVYYSPLQYMYWYDKPSESRDEPELEFFDRAPTVWDDTKVICGEPGQYISIARRSGADWFIGTMTNNDGRKLDLPLDFLPPGETYTAHIYYDDPKSKIRTKAGVKTLTVTNKSVLEAILSPSGGQAVWIEAR